jgi:hypothetical protein
MFAAVLMTAAAAEAEVSTDLSGSIIVWPKVVFDDGRDTVIQLANTSNSLVHARCFYVNAAPAFAGPPGPFNPPRWQETDFEIWLTRQQPYHWVASQGRFVNPFDELGADGAGLDAGAIPPVPEGFTGELKCVQTDASGIPYGGNSLKGEAVIRRADGDVSKYSAVSILANSDLASDAPERELLLNNTVDNDGEFNSCPNTLLFNHFTDGVPDPVIGSLTPIECTDGDCPIRTTLTLVPCSEDFENQIPSRVTVQFAITNELEQEFSASTTVDCWMNVPLADMTAASGTCSQDSGRQCASDQDCIDAGNYGFCRKNGIFSFDVLGTTSAYTRISPVGLDGGVIGVAEEKHFNDEYESAWAAYNLQQEGSRYDATVGVIEGDKEGPVVDVIVIPEI